MDINTRSRRRCVLAIAAIVASGAAAVPLGAPAGPAQATPYCDPVYDGGPGVDLITGNRHNNRICGRAGADSLRGRAGDDLIYGGPGRDQLHGDLGEDTIFGGSGGDQIEGWGGRDFLKGGLGYDVLGGGPDDDTLDPGAGGSEVYGDDGDDRIVADNGYADTVHCGAGYDEVWLDVNDSHSDCEVVH